ncbi:LytR/AlgR family response regulator transcription factor [Acetobacteroides hydrogenigenes]|uniref:Two-component system LytT family response regulator n=1 Tax=Acetobacteroides hydrogenigenes TaxID=979970 RepID=A0A4R2EZ77_9BACT|nr:LytTR family DNA-binding domain-containing protein [Acetobacteroides hydrogenigenes]TCN73267.1 two-component system LytT family response regulator [Acetobacteroides hydrogenigenes]
MIKALILDDEINCIDTLSIILDRKFGDEIKVVAKCTSIQQAIDCMDLYNPQVVFLDVEMPNGTGFDFLLNVKKHNFHVVFITAHESYALKAIKFNAIDYILKPINLNELEVAVSKIMQKIKEDVIINVPEIGNLLDNLKTLKSDSRKVALIGNKQTIFVEIKEIIRFEFDETSTAIYLTGNRVHHSPKSLKDFEEMLYEYNFLRVNVSSIINLSHVKAYINGGGGFAIMSDDSKIEISRRRKNEFLTKTANI